MTELQEQRHDLYLKCLEAEAAWMREIEASLPGRPGDVRYTPAAKGEPGTALAAAHERFMQIHAEWWRLINELAAE